MWITIPWNIDISFLKEENPFFQDSKKEKDVCWPTRGVFGDRFPPLVWAMLTPMIQILLFLDAMMRRMMVRETLQLFFSILCMEPDIVSRQSWVASIDLFSSPFSFSFPLHPNLPRFHPSVSSCQTYCDFFSFPLMLHPMNIQVKKSETSDNSNNNNNQASKSRWEEDGSPLMETIAAGEELSYRLQNLEPSTYYRIEITARNSLGNSLPAYLVFRTADFTNESGMSPRSLLMM